MAKHNAAVKNQHIESALRTVQASGLAGMAQAGMADMINSAYTTGSAPPGARSYMASDLGVR